MNSQGNVDDCLELMRKLIEYRHAKALHHQLMKAADHSMLDIDCYGDRLANRCWVVIDDYFSVTDKGGPTQIQVDELVAAGRLVTLGFYGWGTWIGRWLVD
jgi:hypothetical protein